LALGRGKAMSKKEEIKNPAGKEKLIFGAERNTFADFELRLRVENLTKYLKYALQETINLQNMVYFQQMEPKQNLSDEEKKE
jgi:hypothetical protein